MLKPWALIGIYNLIIEVANFIVPIFGVFNKKLKQGVEGRKKTFSLLEQHITSKDIVFWFHCASLGEYEQGLPVFQQIKKRNPEAKIVLSFFSPSGYEIRRKNPITSLVVYLPIDTRKNVNRFLKLVHPKLVVFVKYDLWPNYLKAIKKSSSHTILISALLRKSQFFFKKFGVNWRWLLFSFDHIFTQNEASKTLLNSIGFHNVTVTKDTRFDRVSNQLKQDNSLKFVSQFLNGSKALVAGSTWPADDQIMLPFINSMGSELKFIMAPHNIDPNYIRALKSTLGDKAVLFSDYDPEFLSEKRILIVDTIGILSKLYSYATVAYVGGGMGSTGLHNTLEPAVFGVPIIIGKNYKKFPEASAMIALGGMTSVSTPKEFESCMASYLSNSGYRQDCGAKNKTFISQNKGATAKIMKYLKLRLEG